MSVTFRVRRFLAELGAVARLSGATARAFFRGPIDLRSLVHQMDVAGIQSWSITALTAVFTGMVLALQFSWGLEPYGGAIYTGKLASMALVTELGPLLTALLVGGRVSSGFAAELGSMVVTEQVDAIRALGADPIKKLVAPRVFACVLTLPLLTMLASVVGLTGAMVITVREVGVTPNFFYGQILETLRIVELMQGLLKAVAFGYIVGIVGCYVGLKTHGGTEGVGNATTRAVVVGAVGVLISNYFITQIYLAIYG